MSVASKESLVEAAYSTQEGTISPKSTPPVGLSISPKTWCESQDRIGSLQANLKPLKAVLFYKIVKGLVDVSLRGRGSR